MFQVRDSSLDFLLIHQDLLRALFNVLLALMALSLKCATTSVHQNIARLKRGKALDMAASHACTMRVRTLLVSMFLFLRE